MGDTHPRVSRCESILSLPEPTEQTCNPDFREQKLAKFYKVGRETGRDICKTHLRNANSWKTTQRFSCVAISRPTCGNRFWRYTRGEIVRARPSGPRSKNSDLQVDHPRYQQYAGPHGSDEGRLHGARYEPIGAACVLYARIASKQTNEQHVGIPRSIQQPFCLRKSRPGLSPRFFGPDVFVSPASLGAQGRGRPSEEVDEDNASQSRSSRVLHPMKDDQRCPGTFPSSQGISLFLRRTEEITMTESTNAIRRAHKAALGKVDSHLRMAKASMSKGMACLAKLRKMYRRRQEARQGG